MGHLFRRLTAMFWFLFLGVVCAFGVNFYSRYEEIYQNKMSEYEVLQEVTIAKLNSNLMLYQQILESSINLFNVTYEGNYEHFEKLSKETLKLLPLYQGLEHVPEEDLLDVMTIKETYIQINKFLDTSFQLYEQKLPVLNLGFIPLQKYVHDEGRYLSEADLENIEQLTAFYFELTDPIEFNWMLNRQLPQYNQLYSTMFRPVYVGEEHIGFMCLDLGSSQVNLNTMAIGKKSVYSFSDLIYPTSDKVIQEVNALLRDDKLDEAIALLSSSGYYAGYSKTNNELVTLLHFLNKEKLHIDVLSETIRLFELNLIILIVLFLIVCYILFISIIKPCYLLVDYVKQCGRGNYEIPNSLTSEWRLPFITIRNAYLDNERLLAVKENQSQELEFAWKKAMVANQAKTHFLAKVSHELRTPLNAIKGYVQLLKITVDDEKHLKKINIIERSSDLLINIVTELLDFSRIEEGKIKLNIQALNLIQIADLLEDMFINDTQAKSLNYSITVEHLIPVVLYGDESRIKQIIINLVSNAIKFTEEGTISVLFKLDNIDADYAYIEIKVTDTGKGISTNKLNAIFDSFTQENNSISRKYGGTGLGLSISKGLAEVMGGNLSVESQVDVGSTFTLFLPLALNLIEEDEI
ncbi:MAG: sensor histidine kinase [Turicibacter sp.]